jgi:hypothetical protein
LNHPIHVNGCFQCANSHFKALNYHTRNRHDCNNATFRPLLDRLPAPRPAASDALEALCRVIVMSEQVPHWALRTLERARRHCSEQCP